MARALAAIPRARRQDPLNPDFTPNEATAAERGWSLRDPDERDLPMLEAAGLLPAGGAAPATAPSPGTGDDAGSTAEPN